MYTVKDFFFKKRGNLKLSNRCKRAIGHKKGGGLYIFLWNYPKFWTKLATHGFKNKIMVFKLNWEGSSYIFLNADKSKK